MTKTAAVAVCLFTAAIASAQGKLVKELTEGGFKVPRNYRGTVQHFVFSPATTRHITTGIAAGKLNRTVSDAVLQHSPIPAPVVLGHHPQEISHNLHMFIAATPLEKEVLIANKAEQKFYEPEITAARKLHNLVLGIKQLNEENTVLIASAILNDIKNHALQTYLLQSLAKQDIYMLDTDLTEYFGLEKNFEITAFNYTLRHPHQQVLMMRRLLNNPLVDEATKQTVRAFLNKPRITPEEFPAFQNAIAALQDQYTQRMLAAQESDIIQTQVAYYAKLVDRLGDFIAQYGRIPKWNTTNPVEIQLFDEIEWVHENEWRNQFEPALSYQHALNLVLKNAQPSYLTRAETIALFDDFVRTTGRIYPYSLRNQPEKGEIPFTREEELWDNLSYWRIKDSSLTAELADIYRKYAHQE